MNTPHRASIAALLAAFLPAASLILTCCAPLSPASTPSPSATPTPTHTPTPLPTYSLDQTSMEFYTIEDFDAAHLPVNGDANEYLIFGNAPVTPPAPDLAPDLAGLLGRWEGYSYGPPVNKDWKFVLVIQEITPLGGNALLWAGTNLQYPETPRTIRFRVAHGANPSIEWTYPENGTRLHLSFTLDPDEGILRGFLDTPTGTWGPIKLNRDRNLTVYKDYAQYLADKGITVREYQDTGLRDYGKGYMLYLPEGYEADTEKTWPLIIFLHGSGDWGDNVYLLAKASPFMMIREKGPLPFIIAAPLLNSSPDYRSFPEEYMEGMLAEILADYRVDRTRIYLTGLSMGGEATYRFALHQPEIFAAIAPLAAFNPKYNLSEVRDGFEPFDLPMSRIKDVPVWAIHGANDIVVPVGAAQATVDDLKRAGGDVRFTILENHDHDVWTDTYSDPAFYKWLLEHHRP